MSRSNFFGQQARIRLHRLFPAALFWNLRLSSLTTAKTPPSGIPITGRRGNHGFGNADAFRHSRTVHRLSLGASAGWSTWRADFLRDGILDHACKHGFPFLMIPRDVFEKTHGLTRLFLYMGKILIRASALPNLAIGAVYNGQATIVHLKGQMGPLSWSPVLAIGNVGRWKIRRNKKPDLSAFYEKTCFSESVSNLC